MADDANAIRAEWRAEEDAWTRAAFERWEHERTLADVLRDAMHRGDAVTVSFGEVGWTGELVAVGTDVARIATGGAVVDVRLAPDAPLVVRLRKGRGVGGRGDGTVTTFAARLRELDGTCACIGAPGVVLEGLVRVGRDHVRVADAGDVAYVPVASVGWVRAVDVD
jgi:hypothetical protein